MHTYLIAIFKAIKETFDRIKKENGDIEVLVNLTSDSADDS